MLSRDEVITDIPGKKFHAIHVYTIHVTRSNTYLRHFRQCNASFLTKSERKSCLSGAKLRNLETRIPRYEPQSIILAPITNTSRISFVVQKLFELEFSRMFEGHSNWPRTRPTSLHSFSKVAFDACLKIIQDRLKIVQANFKRGASS